MHIRIKSMQIAERRIGRVSKRMLAFPLSKLVLGLEARCQV